MCVPLHLEDTLPEYLVPLKTFNASMQRIWSPGDVFRMFFAADEGGGSYYKGVVVKVLARQRSAMRAARAGIATTVSRFA